MNVCLSDTQRSQSKSLVLSGKRRIFDELLRLLKKEALNLGDMEIVSDILDVIHHGVSNAGSSTGLPLQEKTF